MTLPNIVARLLQKKTKKSKRFKSRQLRKKEIKGLGLICMCAVRNK